MHDLGYIVAGYGVTGATLAGYRLRLALRTRRARRAQSALAGRSAALRRRGS